MFGKEAQPTTSAPQASAVKTDDMILHVMPKEFLGRVALPLSAPVVAAVPKPVPPPVAAAPVVAPAPKPAAVVQAPPRRKFGLVIVLFLLLLLIAASGIGAYYYYFLMPVPVVAPTPLPEPTPTPTPTPTPVPVPAEPVPGKDTDSDGLTDVEELLYGTDYRNPDTDGDTYLDGNEVFHRYHPNGSAPQTLLDTGAVRIFQSPESPFTVYYPSTWTPVVTPVETPAAPESTESAAPISPVAPVSTSVTFRSPSTATIIVSTIAKDPNENLEVWYQQNVPNNNEQALEPSYTTQGLLALSKPGERVAYIDGGSKVFTLTYSLGDEATIEFLTTFQMMLNSLTLLP